MCTITTTTFTPEQIIIALGGQVTAVGSYNAAAITTDLQNGDFSRVGIAATLLNKWCLECQVDISNMSVPFCGILSEGFKFFVLYQYSVLWVNTQKSCSCDCANDIVQQEFLKEQTCRFFCQISICLKKRFIDYTNMDCTDTIQPNYDFSAFGVVSVTNNCVYNTPPPCDSCGC